MSVSLIVGDDWIFRFALSSMIRASSLSLYSTDGKGREDEQTIILRLTKDAIMYVCLSSMPTNVDKDLLIDNLTEKPYGEIVRDSPISKRFVGISIVIEQWQGNNWDLSRLTCVTVLSMGAELGRLIPMTWSWDAFDALFILVTSSRRYLERKVHSIHQSRMPRVNRRRRGRCHGRTAGAITLGTAEMNDLRQTGTFFRTNLQWHRRIGEKRLFARLFRRWTAVLRVPRGNRELLQGTLKTSVIIVQRHGR